MVEEGQSPRTQCRQRRSLRLGPGAHSYSEIREMRRNPKWRGLSSLRRDWSKGSTQVNLVGFCGSSFLTDFSFQDLFEREREQEHTHAGGRDRRRGRESQSDSPLSMEPDMGLDSITLSS